MAWKFGIFKFSQNIVKMVLYRKLLVSWVQLYDWIMGKKRMLIYVDYSSL